MSLSDGLTRTTLGNGRLDNVCSASIALIQEPQSEGLYGAPSAREDVQAAGLASSATASSPPLALDEHSSTPRPSTPPAFSSSVRSVASNERTPRSEANLSIDGMLADPWLRTPRKKMRASRAVSTDSPASQLVGISSSPTRCSPSKRCSPFSSSSPTRSALLEGESTIQGKTARPLRRRSRTLSGTEIIIEGLACTTMQCNNDLGSSIFLSEKDLQPAEERVSKDEGAQINVGVAAILAVKTGLRKYTPLFKSSWSLSGSNKVETYADSTVNVRGGKNIDQNGLSPSSIVSKDAPGKEADNIDWQTRAARTTATVLASPPLTAKEDVSKLSTSPNPFSIASATAVLGPAFEGEVSTTTFDINVRPICTPTPARATRGQSLQACQRTHQDTSSQYLPSVRTSLPSKRNKRMIAALERQPYAGKGSFVPLDPNAVLDTTQAGGLGIVCAQEIKSGLDYEKSLQSPQYRTGMSGSLSWPNSPTDSVDSSVPSIIVTPPAVFTARTMLRNKQRVQHGGVCLDYLDTTAAELVSPEHSRYPIRQDDDDVNLDLMQVDESIAPTSLSSPVSLKSETPEMRKLDDEVGMAKFKATVDSVLSQYFVRGSVDNSLSQAHDILRIIQRTYDPVFCFPSIPTGIALLFKPTTVTPLASLCSQATQSNDLPSLCSNRRIREGEDTVKGTVEWGFRRLEIIMDMIMEHTVTGIVALVTDERAPYKTPAAMAYLCRLLQKQLPSLEKVHSLANLTSQHAPNPPGSSVPGSSSVLLDEQSREVEAKVWDKVLRDINPAEIFMRILRRTIQDMLEKGETIRSEATLLAVPPPRKGSRKRWQAANAKMNALRAGKEEDISQVTRGIISESEFRKRERKRAATGSAKDAFAVFFFVRFVGELYKSKVIEVNIVQQWLLRYFFDTVFPGVPSLYELEAGCALLITVGDTLDCEGGFMGTTSKNFPPISSYLPKPKDSAGMPTEGDLPTKSMNDPAVAAASPPLVKRCTDDVPANHWILVNPRTMREMRASCQDKGAKLLCHLTSGESDLGVLPKSEVARILITATIARLHQIIAIPEVDREGRQWCQEVIGLRRRLWMPRPYLPTPVSGKKMPRKQRLQLWTP